VTTTTTVRPTTAAEKILTAYGDDLNSALTAKALMDATGLSRTTVNTTLNKMAEKGDVIRLDDKVTTWSLTPTRKAVIKRAANKAAATSKPAARTTRPASRKTATSKTKGNKVTDSDSTAAANAADESPRTATGRRVKGAIDNEIREWFRANGNTPEGSYKVAKGIGSSAGAAYVALRRMTSEGKARLVSTEPDRYDIDESSDAWNE
jgi:DNA-binding MarR family transcriptional regulator